MLSRIYANGRQVSQEWTRCTRNIFSVNSVYAMEARLIKILKNEFDKKKENLKHMYQRYCDKKQLFTVEMMNKSKVF